MKISPGSSLPKTIHDLDLSRQWRYKPVPPKPVKIVGLDTETFRGLCRLICDSSGRIGRISSFEDLISFLTNRNLRDSVNVFFNIEYDFNAILKYLPFEELRTLYYLKHIKKGDLELEWIPGKYFAIHKNKRTYEFFDLFQFYNSSLNVASKKYLGQEKIDYDVEKLAQEETWETDFDNIAKYCVQDCKLTAQLGQILANKFLEIGLSFKKPFSIASLSAQWVARNCNIPKFQPFVYQDYAYNAYHGGRFEIFKRGFIKKAYEIDISSAYPYQLVNLLDIDKGYWEESTKEQDCDIGFVKAAISTYDNYIAPYPVDYRSQIVYPDLTNKIAYITYDEYKFIRDRYKNVDIELIDGWFFHPTQIEYPFEKFKELYALKDKHKDGDKMLYRIYKILQNAYYGKTIERTPKLHIVDEALADESVEIITDEEAGLYAEKLHAGAHFNPVYASLITARTRLQLLDRMLINPRSVIACFTDSIFFTEEPEFNTGGLGSWSDEGTGPLLMVQSGVYTFMPDGREVVSRFRGFRNTRNVNLVEWFTNNPRATTLKRLIEKPQKLGETIQHSKRSRLENFNSFVEVEKALHINADKKREWERDFKNCEDALSSVIDSTPLVV